MLTLLDFKNPYVDEIMLELAGKKEYERAYDILTKVRDRTERELCTERSSVTVLVKELIDYLNTDALHASSGALQYLHQLQKTVAIRFSMPIALLEHISQVNSGVRIN